MLPILPAREIPPRFFRVHFLTALGLMSVASMFLIELADAWFWLLFAVAAVGCLVGSIVWHLDEAPGGIGIAWTTPIFLAAATIYAGGLRVSMTATLLSDEALCALVLGSVLSAMLMGHSYLIAPAMTMAPLMRLLAASAIAIFLRIGLACHGLWGWTSTHTPSNLELEFWLFLSARWALGFIAPLVLGWMAWETARIRSTQSATGILYVVVVLCFLGELLSMVLTEKTGLVL